MSAFLLLSLSISSSLDNFAVGISLGLTAKNPENSNNGIPHTFNFIIAFCNSLGALASTYIGLKFGHVAPMVASWISAFAFLYLGMKEGYDWYTQEKEEGSSEVMSTNVASAWKLAIPMTLNNIAGGVAGGLAGTDPILMFLMALFVSYGLMNIGYLLGSLYASHTNHGRSDTNCSSVDPRIASSCIFIGLGLLQLV